RDERWARRRQESPRRGQEARRIDARGHRPDEAVRCRPARRGTRRREGADHAGHAQYQWPIAWGRPGTAAADPRRRVLSVAERVVPKPLTPPLKGHAVVVSGGGLGGLPAARDLIARGADVRVLEARERLGGRVWTIH